MYDLLATNAVQPENKNITENEFTCTSKQCAGMQRDKISDEACHASGRKSVTMKQRKVTRASAVGSSSSSSSLVWTALFISTFVGFCLVMPSSVDGSPLAAAHPGPAEGDQHQHESKFEKEMTDKDVLDAIVSSKLYDMRVRPPSVGAILVNVSVLLLSLSSPDESSLKYEVEFLVHLFWMDTRLAHNETSGHQYLNGIHHQQHLWLPDIYFLKHGDFKHPPDPVHIALRIYNNGTVHYTARKHLVLSCEGDGDVFPFDDPLCTFSVESISYEREDLIFKWVNDFDTRGTTLRTSKRLTTLNAYMVENRTSECEAQLTWRGNYSCLMVELVFTRDKSFYLSTVFIPGIILVTSSFITFWLEWSAAPARVVIGVTTLLTFFTTSNGFRTSLPVVAKLGAMNVWDAVCMFFIYASLLEFVLVNYVGRKKPAGNAVYTPGENAVIQRIPAVIQRIGLTLVSPLQMSSRNKQSQAQAADRRNKVPEALPLNCATCGATPCAHVTSLGDDVEENLMPSSSLKMPLKSNQAASGDAGRSNSNGPPTGSGQTSTISNVQFRMESEKPECHRRRMPPLATSDSTDDVLEPAPASVTASSTPPSTISNKEELQLQPMPAQDPAACSSCTAGISSKNDNKNKDSADSEAQKGQSTSTSTPGPIHPIRIAKTIDVISRVLFPTAYFCFLIFFFARYAWFNYMWNDRER